MSSTLWASLKVAGALAGGIACTTLVLRTIAGGEDAGPAVVAEAPSPAEVQGIRPDTTPAAPAEVAATVPSAVVATPPVRETAAAATLAEPLREPVSAASASEPAKKLGCEGKAWPYVNPTCAEPAATGALGPKRPTRVISTDRPPAVAATTSEEVRGETVAEAAPPPSDPATQQSEALGVAPQVASVPLPPARPADLIPAPIVAEATPTPAASPVEPEPQALAQPSPAPKPGKRQVAATPVAEEPAAAATARPERQASAAPKRAEERAAKRVEARAARERAERRAAAERREIAERRQVAREARVRLANRSARSAEPREEVDSRPGLIVTRIRTYRLPDGREVQVEMKPRPEVVRELMAYNAYDQAPRRLYPPRPVGRPGILSWLTE